mmetsp:Transcript_90835/g.243257  ORF Transcript_90835/g.243257 Transcript_90835/m.243257 type:complete len:152 (+) Transcript_90835:160-615(+)
MERDKDRQVAKFQLEQERSLRERIESDRRNQDTAFSVLHTAFQQLGGEVKGKKGLAVSNLASTMATLGPVRRGGLDRDTQAGSTEQYRKHLLDMQTKLLSVEAQLAERDRRIQALERETIPGVPSRLRPARQHRQAASTPDLLPARRCYDL